MSDPEVYARVVVIRRDGKDGAVFPLSNTSCLFGRSDECDVRIQLPDVLMEHCKLVISEDKQICLLNLAKTNLTRVNGNQIATSQVLANSDVFTIADRSFRIEIAGANAGRVLQPVSTNGPAPSNATPNKRQQLNGKTPLKQVSSAVKKTSDAKSSSTTPSRSVPAASFYKGDKDPAQAKIADESSAQLKSIGKSTTPVRTATSTHALPDKAGTPGRTAANASGSVSADENGVSNRAGVVNASGSKSPRVNKINTPTRVGMAAIATPTLPRAVTPARTGITSKTPNANKGLSRSTNSRNGSAAENVAPSLSSQSATPNRTGAVFRTADASKTGSSHSTTPVQSGKAVETSKTTIPASRSATPTRSGISKTDIVVKSSRAVTPSRVETTSSSVASTRTTTPSRNNKTDQSNSDSKSIPSSASKLVNVITPAKPLTPARASSGTNSSASKSTSGKKAKSPSIPGRMAKLASKKQSPTPQREKSPKTIAVEMGWADCSSDTPATGKKAKSPKRVSQIGNMQWEASSGNTETDAMTEIVDKPLEVSVTADVAVASPVNRKQSASKNETPGSIKVGRFSISSAMAAESSLNNTVASPRGIKRSGGSLKSPKAKRRGVSFGPAMSPELFDGDLPPKTPVKRGQTPQRVTMSAYAGSLKPVLKGQAAPQPQNFGATPELTSSSKRTPKSKRSLSADTGAASSPVVEGVNNQTNQQSIYLTPEQTSSAKPTPKSKRSLSTDTGAASSPVVEGVNNQTSQQTSQQQSIHSTPELTSSAKRTPKSKSKRSLSTDTGATSSPVVEGVNNQTSQQTSQQQSIHSTPELTSSAKRTPKSKSKRSLSTDTGATSSPVVEGVNNQTSQQTSQQQSIHSTPELTSSAKRTPKSKSKRSLSTDTGATSSPVVEGVNNQTSQQTSQQQSIHSTPELTSSAKRTPKSKSKRSLSTDTGATSSPVVEGVNNQTSQQTSRQQSIHSTPELTSSAKRTPKSKSKRSLSTDTGATLSPGVEKRDHSTPKQNLSDSAVSGGASPSSSSNLEVLKSGKKRSVGTPKPLQTISSVAAAKATPKSAIKLSRSSEVVTTPDLFASSQSPGMSELAVKRSSSVPTVAETPEVSKATLKKHTPKSVKRQSVMVLDSASPPVVLQVDAPKSPMPKTPRQRKSSIRALSDDGTDDHVPVKITPTAASVTSAAFTHGSAQITPQMAPKQLSATAQLQSKGISKVGKKRAASLSNLFDSPIVESESAIKQISKSAKPARRPSTSSKKSVSGMKTPPIFDASLFSLSSEAVISNVEDHVKKVTTPRLSKSAKKSVPALFDDAVSPVMTSPAMLKSAKKSSKKLLSTGMENPALSGADGSPAIAETVSVMMKKRASSPAILPVTPTAGELKKAHSASKSAKKLPAEYDVNPSNAELSVKEQAAVYEDPVPAASPVVKRQTPKSAKRLSASVKKSSVKKSSEVNVNALSKAIIVDTAQLDSNLDNEGLQLKTPVSAKKPRKSLGKKRANTPSVALKNAKKFRRSTADVESMPHVVKAGLVTPGRAVALRAIFGKSAISNLKSLMPNTADAGIEDEVSAAREMHNATKETSATKKATPATKKATPAKSAKKSAVKKMLWSEIVSKTNPSLAQDVDKVKRPLPKKKKTASVHSSSVSKKIESTTGHALSPATIVIGKKRRQTLSTSSISDDLPSTPEGPGEMMISPMVTSDKRRSVPPARHSDFIPSNIFYRSPGVRKSVKTPKTQATPNLEGVRKLMKTPKPQKTPAMDGMRNMLKTPSVKSSPNLEGVRKMVKTPQPQKTPAMGGMRNMLKTPSVQSSPNLEGVRKMMKTPKPQKTPAMGGMRNMLKTPSAQSSPNLEGVRKMMKTPKPQKTPNLAGLREMVKTPELQQSPNLSGMRKMMKTPKVLKTPKLVGLRELVHTPAVTSSPDLTGVKQIFAASDVQPSPVLVGVRQMLKTPKHLKTPKLAGVKQMLKTPKVQKSPQTAGVRDLMKTPQAFNSPVLDGLQSLFQAPTAKSAVKSITAKKNKKSAVQTARNDTSSSLSAAVLKETENLAKSDNSIKLSSPDNVGLESTSRSRKRPAEKSTEKASTKKKKLEEPVITTAKETRTSRRGVKDQDVVILANASAKKAQQVNVVGVDASKKASKTRNLELQVSAEPPADTSIPKSTNASRKRPGKKLPSPVAAKKKLVELDATPVKEKRTTRRGKKEPETAVKANTPIKKSSKSKRVQKVPNLVTDEQPVADLLATAATEVQPEVTSKKPVKSVRGKKNANGLVLDEPTENVVELHQRTSRKTSAKSASVSQVVVSTSLEPPAEVTAAVATARTNSTRSRGKKEPVLTQDVKTSHNEAIVLPSPSKKQTRPSRGTKQVSEASSADVVDKADVGTNASAKVPSKRTVAVKTTVKSPVHTRKGKQKNDTGSLVTAQVDDVIPPKSKPVRGLLKTKPAAESTTPTPAMRTSRKREAKKSPESVVSPIRTRRKR